MPKVSELFRSWPNENRFAARDSLASHIQRYNVELAADFNGIFYLCIDLPTE